MQYLSFCVWLISLSLMCSRFIHVIANDRISFFFKAKEYSCVCVCVCVCVSHFFIHLSADGYLDCFHIFAIVTNAATNMEMQISLQDTYFISFVPIPRSVKHIDF